MATFLVKKCSRDTVKTIFTKVVIGGMYFGWVESYQRNKCALEKKNNGKIEEIMYHRRKYGSLWRCGFRFLSDMFITFSCVHVHTCILCDTTYRKKLKFRTSLRYFILLSYLSSINYCLIFIYNFSIIKV